jgi:abortive infection bacteriophage resistance protein
MATELISFGTLSQMYANLRKSLRKKIAREFDQPATVFVSWLHALTAVRNACAHHARLWNKELAVKPELPKAWVGAGLDNRRFYAIALIIQTLLCKVSPESRWKQRLKAHIDTYPDVDIAHMHFPPNWAELPPWNLVKAAALEAEAEESTYPETASFQSTRPRTKLQRTQ